MFLKCLIIFLKKTIHIHFDFTLQGTEDDDDNETRVDPFDIDCDTCYTPIGIAFIDVQSLSSNQSVPKCVKDVADSSAKIIGTISISFDICSKKWIVQNRPKKLSPVNIVCEIYFVLHCF